MRAPEATYEYEGADGEPLFRVNRFPGKKFSQQHREGDRWLSGRNGTAPIPYRLPELRAAIAAGDLIYLVEGERDADNAAGEDVVATTVPGGAGKFSADLAAYFEGADVRIIPDRDKPGQEHAIDVADKLAGIAASVDILDVAAGKDLSDHLDAGHGIDDLMPSKLKPRGSKSKRTTTRPLDVIEAGQRNTTLTREGGSLRRAGLDQNRIARFLLALNEHRCRPPLPEAEVRTIAASLAQYKAPEGVAREVVSVAASAVKPRRKRFLLHGMIPLAAMTALLGRAGEGKTTWAVELASAGSRGEVPGDLRGNPWATAFITHEDDLEATLAPRFVAAGADLDRIHFVDARQAGERDIFTLPEDLPALAELVRQHGIRLVVIDPLSASLPGSADSWKDADVRRVLAPVRNFAEEAQVAVLGIFHPTKSGPSNALSRMMGSGAFGNTMRSVLVFGQDPKDADPHGNRRILAHAKHNTGPKAESVAYRLEGTTIEGADHEIIETSFSKRVGPSSISADQLLAYSEPDDNEKLSDAEVFLKGELADGPRPFQELQESAKAAGVGWPDVERAKRRLRAKSKREGGIAAAGSWCWVLPEKRKPRIVKNKKGSKENA